MKRSEIPSLDDIRAFEAVARLGSVRAASEELALTHGAVSRRISKLAKDIDVSLVEPAGRGIRLTQDGEALSKAAEKALEELSGALAEIRSKPVNGPIVLSCERSVAMRWLIPRISTFQDRYPEVELHLSVGGGSFDFEKDRITLAIRRLDFPIEPNWTVLPLMQESIGPVMKPNMKIHFDSHNYIGLASGTRPDAWQAWLAQNPSAPRPREIRQLDHHFLMVEAAANGLGVALSPYVLARDEMERDRLVAPMGFAEDGSSYGLIYPAALPLTDPIKRIIEWLEEISAET